MRISEHCAECLYRKEANRTDNEGYLREVRRVIDERDADDVPAYMVYLFDQLAKKYFGQAPSFQAIKKKYNDLVLSMEGELRKKIVEADDPLMKAFAYARIGNYIDFGALDHVDDETFLKLFEAAVVSEKDEITMKSFKDQCQKASSFLLITDNCGEIVVDKLFLEILRQMYPQLDISVLVRGGEAINDATMEDALYVGIDKVAKIYTNGQAMSGTIYKLMPEDARRVVDEADVILAKGQGNFESLTGEGRHIFFSFLCKCDYFMGKFGVLKLTGMFVEEM